MKEAIGQTISLQVILVFVVFLNAFLAFSVNYTKAFRVKNKVINILEQNEGFNGAAASKIDDYMSGVGYNVNIQGERDGIGNCKNGVCILAHCAGRIGDDASSGECPTGASDKQDYRIYYSVTTYINVSVPIINRILNQDMPIFRIQGDTSTIYVSGNIADLTTWEN